MTSRRCSVCRCWVPAELLPAHREIHEVRGEDLHDWEDRAPVDHARIRALDAEIAAWYAAHPPPAPPAHPGALKLWQVEACQIVHARTIRTLFEGPGDIA